MDSKSIPEDRSDNPNQQPNLEDLISLHEAAEISGLSHGHLALLIRRGDLWGKKIGRDCLATKMAVLDYLASNHKPGQVSPLCPLSNNGDESIQQPIITILYQDIYTQTAPDLHRRMKQGKRPVEIV